MMGKLAWMKRKITKPIRRTERKHDNLFNGNAYLSSKSKSALHAFTGAISVYGILVFVVFSLSFDGSQDIQQKFIPSYHRYG